MSDHFDQATKSKGKSENSILNSFISELSNLSIEKQQSTHILDLGSGTGDLSALILKKFPNVIIHTCDIVDYGATKLGAKHFQCNFNVDFASIIGPSHYDMIVSSEVIEHLENPRLFIRNIQKLLKPGGLSLLSTPNPESLTSILSYFFRGYHSAFGPRNYPAHICPLSLYEIKNIINEVETLFFESVTYIRNGRVPGCALKWNSVLPFLRGKRFSDNYIVRFRKVI